MGGWVVAGSGGRCGERKPEAYWPDMPRLWLGATLRERHQLRTTILDAVYIDLKDKKSIVSVKAKPAFQAVLGMATPNWDLSTTLAVR